jgi:hypothetical protein
MGEMSWTQEMDAALVKGRSDGLTAEMIGQRLGVTRNAVLGRTFRLGMADGSRPFQPTQGPAVERSRAAKERGVQRRMRLEHNVRLRALVAEFRAAARAFNDTEIIAIRAVIDNAKMRTASQ